MTDYLFDTNILIYRLRNNPKVEHLLEQLTEASERYISTITRAEILAGMHPNESTKTLALLQSFSSVSVDDNIADLAGQLLYRYARQGITLSLADMLIAATAIEHNLTLITTNGKHFPIPELLLQVLEQNKL
jgi:predicted nucleic acid-binding protein